MPLRPLLESAGETVQDLVLAADERFWEGWELAVQGQYFACIYLTGYSAEMLLKVAAFRFDGALPGDPVVPRLQPAKAYGYQYLPAVPDKSPRSLHFWAAYLERKRVDAGQPIPAALHVDLMLRVDRMHEGWWVSMRYRSSADPTIASLSIQTEALTLLEDVEWLRRNHSDLWR